MSRNNIGYDKNNKYSRLVEVYHFSLNKKFIANAMKKLKKSIFSNSVVTVRVRYDVWSKFKETRI